MPGKYKLKTNKAAMKRFRGVTANGKIKRSKRNHGHFLSKMGGRKARKLQGVTYVAEDNFEMIAKMLPALPAKKRRTKFLRRKAAALAAEQTQATQQKASK